MCKTREYKLERMGCQLGQGHVMLGDTLGSLCTIAKLKQNLQSEPSCHCNGPPTGGQNTWWPARFIGLLLLGKLYLLLDLRDALGLGNKLKKRRMAKKSCLEMAYALYMFIAFCHTLAHDLVSENQTLLNLTVFCQNCCYVWICCSPVVFEQTDKPNNVTPVFLPVWE